MYGEITPSKGFGLSSWVNCGAVVCWERSRFKNSFINMLSLRCPHWHPSGDNEWESRFEYRVQEGELWILCLNLKVISKQRVPKALRVGEVIKRIHVQGEKEKR